MDNENLKSMKSKEFKTCALRNCDSVNFNALFDAEYSKILDWNIASAEASVRYFKNMTDIDTSIDQKEIVKIICAVSSICENSGTEYLPEKYSNQTDVPSIDTERNDSKIISSQAIDVPFSISRVTGIPVFGIKTTDPKGISEATDATGIDSETADATEIISEMTANTGRSVIPDATGIDSETTDATGMDSETTDATGIDSETTDATGIDSETADATEIISEMTANTGRSVIPDATGIDSGTTDATGIDSGTTDATGIDSETADATEIISETTANTGRSVITDATGIVSETTDATGIDSETADATEIISETTANTGIRSVIPDAIGRISIIITDVAGSKMTDAKGMSSEITDGVAIRIEMTDFPEISNEITDLTVILNETNNTTEIISETTDSLRTCSETTDSLRMCSETTDSLRMCSETLDSRIICCETTDSVSEPDVKADKIDTGTITLVNYPKNVFTANRITECKGKYLKVPEKICKQFSKSTGRTCEPIEKAYSNNEKSIQTKDISMESCERKNRHNQTCDIEKFLDAVNVTNKDMVRKSGILLQKQNLVAEVLSYVHAVQSIFRLSTNLFTNHVPRDSEANKQFYGAGEFILEELKHYQSELKADFQDWEDFRIKILNISERIVYDLESCENEKSSRILMHGITTEICTILRNMEIISSKREEKNEECIDLMDGVDTYIKFSSAFIMGNKTLTLL